ncbi:unnamed protein product [Caenorhabditis angaria]|uniref:DOMON domain-containing protein n=1 Tax=Caenorhabditis angaria TaxID=860376 RepID=A0A9P1MU35_9PELO|nr:unnamed protein product [Caenorhabditis angaria]
MIRFVTFFIFTSFLLLFSFVNSRGISTHYSTDKCSYSLPNYSINWSFDELSNDVVFKLVAKSNFSNFYTSIGFGNSGSQATDVIAVYVRSGQIGLIDGKNVDEEIESDERTNVQALQFDYQNNTLTAQFARPLESIDSSDADLTDCATFYFPAENAEIISGSSLSFPFTSKTLRVCDISLNCAVKSHTEVVKRAEEEVCESGGESEKNRVEWKIEGENVRFTVNQNTKKGRWYTAIGVGKSMEDLNMIVIFAENGNWKKQGLYRTEGYQLPQSYEQNNIELSEENVKNVNGKLSYDILINKEFLTSRTDENGCIPLQIAVVAGQYTPKFEIRKHQSTPQSFSVCNLEGCGVKKEETVKTNDEENTTTKEIPIAISTTTPASIEIPSTPKIVEDLEDAPKESEVKTTKTPILEEVEASGNEPTTPIKPIEDNESSGELLATSTTQKNIENIGSQLEEKPLTEDNNNDAPQQQQQETSTTTLTPKVLPIIDSSTTTKEANIPQTSSSSGCGADHEDLKVCESYFSEYLGKVTSWSERHNMKVASHMWKACTLLSQVQHVTTMCCTLFRQTCATHLNL